VITLLLALTGCTYDDEYTCEPWQGWWSGELTGDLDATLVGEFYAFFAGVVIPGGGGSLNLSLRDLDLGPLIDQPSPVSPSAAYGVASIEGGECEAAWRGTLGLVVDLAIVEEVDDTGDTGDTGEGVQARTWTGTLVGQVEDPEDQEPAAGWGTWSLTGSDGDELSGDWSLGFDADFPSAS